MTPSDVLAALSLINGLIIQGQKLAITLDGEEMTNEELYEYIDEAILQIELNRDND